MRISPLIAATVLSGAVWAWHSEVSDAQRPKAAGEAFKNVQVLKRVPEEQWFDTMAFIAGSLGVTCDHCHSSGFAIDEGNPNKLKAREMMRMVDRINQEQFGGRIAVTCNTCHRGSVKPQGAPIPDAEHWMKAAENTSSMPAAREIIARYRKSIGSIKTQMISVQIETYSGKGPARLATAEVWLDGDKAHISDREGKNLREMIRNEQGAWIDDGKGWRAMSKGETFDAFEVAEVLAPDQIGEVVPSAAAFQDQIAGRRSYVVPVTSKDVRKWLFFDANTFALLKQRLFFTSFYGDGSLDINYGGYRKFGNAMLPTNIEVVNAGGAGLIVRQVISRKVNIKFAQKEFQVWGG